jgi:hypothetical protein
VRRRLPPLAAALLAGLAAPAPAAAPVAPKLVVTAGGSHAVATAGARCKPTPRADGSPAVKCTSDRYPLATHGHVTLRPRRRVLLRFDRRISSIQVRLLHAATTNPSTVYAARPGQDGRDRRRYVLRLPRRIPCAAILDAFVVRTDGSDVDYWVRVRTPGCRRR